MMLITATHWNREPGKKSKNENYAADISICNFLQKIIWLLIMRGKCDACPSLSQFLFNSIVIIWKVQALYFYPYVF